VTLALLDLVWVRRAWLLVVATAACTGQGDRAVGGCPPFEVCSPDTPNGLGFLGAPLGDQPLGRMGPLPVATGGTQTIRVVTGASSTSPPFDQDFEAVSSDAALGIDSFDPPDVTVHGLHAGEAHLRILDPDNDLLYDRFTVQVRNVARALVRPRDACIATTDRDFTLQRDMPWVTLAGATIDVLVQLEGPSGERLADETMLIGAADGVFALERESWDVVRVRADAAGVVTVRTGDGVDRNGSVTVVSTVEDILSVPAVGAAQSTTQAQRPGAIIFCFRATNGGKLVAGAQWHFAAPAFSVSAAQAPSCTTVTGTAGQTGTLEVTASGTLRQFALTFSQS